MKNWIKPILCVGILASGTIAISDMKVQASGYQMGERDEAKYHLSTSEAFQIDNVDTDSVNGEIMYRLAPADVLDAPAPIKLPDTVARIFMMNPDALINWEMKICTKYEPLSPVVNDLVKK
ncbi:hypothetical protein, partial [Bacillus tropicus]